MVNLVAAQKPLLHGLMKLAGVVPHAVVIEPGTVMNIWVPSEIIKKPQMPKKSDSFAVEDGDSKCRKPNPKKPVVVLVHGFAAEGIVTWQFQIGSLTKKYSVYVPDLLFFGGSSTDNPDRSPIFQAECLVKCLRSLGIDRCTVVGFSYGGMVAFKMAEMYPELVESVVISGSILAMTDSISSSTLEDLGFLSSSELLLPTSVGGAKALLRVAMYKNIWFPDRLYKDFLEVMFNNRKERAQLLDALIVDTKDTNIPIFSQRIHLLWGENDQIFKFQHARDMKEDLGEKVTIESIAKAGHLVHLERPCIYNRCLNKILDSFHKDELLHQQILNTFAFNYRKTFVFSFICLFTYCEL